MPQMMPINWMIYLFIFTCTFITFNMMNYYIFNVKTNSNKMLKKKMNNFNWKW